MVQAYQAILYAHAYQAPFGLPNSIRKI